MTLSIADAFDLPDWLGTVYVVWRATSALEESAHVAGQLTAGDDRSHELDLLAIDEAYPRPVCPEPERTAAHQAWHYGEVLLLKLDSRLTAAVPGTRFDANLICETLRRVAKAVGAPAANFTAAVTL
jgi:hypothetical protein